MKFRETLVGTDRRYAARRSRAKPTNGTRDGKTSRPLRSPQLRERHRWGVGRWGLMRLATWGDGSFGTAASSEGGEALVAPSLGRESVVLVSRKRNFPARDGWAENGPRRPRAASRPQRGAEPPIQGSFVGRGKNSRRAKARGGPRTRTYNQAATSGRPPIELWAGRKPRRGRGGSGGARGPRRRWGAKGRRR